tara:strand:- start:279 stop:452 length:174 start_codon:yes stop_codon:yes gene_type:complete
MSNIIPMNGNKHTRDKAHMFAKINEAIALKALYNGRISQEVFDKEFTYDKLLLKLIP